MIDGKEAGITRSAAGNIAIGIVRVDAAASGAGLIDNASVKIVVPHWH